MAYEHVNLKRRPFLAPIWLTVTGAVAWLLVGALVAWAAWTWITAQATTVIVVRHAEKVMDGGPDPALTAAGQARADSLARLLADGQVPGHLDAIYVSATLRSRMTAAPIAARLGLTPVVGPGDDAARLVSQILHEHRGGRVLVVAHSDTIDAIVEHLSGAKGLPAIAADEYGTIYIVTVPRIGRANFLRLNY